MHSSGLGRTHPVTSVRFEEKTLNSTVQRRNRRAGSSCSGFCQFSAGFFFFFSSRKFGSTQTGTVLKVCSEKESGDTAACQLQKKRTDTDLDMAVSSDFLTSHLALKSQSDQAEQSRTRQSVRPGAGRQKSPGLSSDSMGRDEL